MKFLIYSHLFWTFWLGFIQPVSGQIRQRKAVFIIVDGIPPDVLEKVPTPHLDSLAGKGKYLKAYVGGGAGTYSQTPTISAVGYNSLLTGTWANKHNVWDNAIKEPNYHYPSIFRLLKNQYPEKKTAIFSSWTDNRTKLVGESLPETGGIRLDYHFDGYELDTITFPHDAQRDFMHRIDETVTNAAVTCLQEKGPDLSWVYLEYNDDMGHKYGDSEPFYRSVALMDAQIGRISKALQYRQKQFAEDWLLIITTDHGRDEKTGKHHGGQSERERSTWMVTNYPALNEYARQSTPGIVDIMPTLARFMNVTLPPDVANEVDGVPLIGKVSLSHPQVTYQAGKMLIRWKAWEKAGEVKIRVATTNEFKTGGKDSYSLRATIPLTRQQAIVDVSKHPSKVYKVVLEGPSNTVNQWVVEETE